MARLGRRSSSLGTRLSIKGLEDKNDKITIKQVTNKKTAPIVVSKNSPEDGVIAMVKSDYVTPRKTFVGKNTITGRPSRVFIDFIIWLVNSGKWPNGKRIK